MQTVVNVFVGGHGAGLTNMLFAPPGATIIEFGMKPHVDRCYGFMALALGLDYWLLPQVWLCMGFVQGFSLGFSLACNHIVAGVILVFVDIRSIL